MRRFIGQIVFCLSAFFLIQVGSAEARDFPPEPEQTREAWQEEIPDWQARWELARLLSYQERYSESIEQYQKLLQEKPELTEVKQELARVYFWAGQLEQAEEIFQEIPQEELSQEALLDKAEIYLTREEYQKAKEIYTDYLQDKPQDHQVRFKLAQVLSWQGEYDQALEEFERLLKARPEDVQLRRKYAQVLVWAERYEQAIDQLQKTLQD